MRIKGGLTMLARMRRNIVIEKSLRVVLAPSSDSQAEDK